MGILDKINSKKGIKAVSLNLSKDELNIILQLIKNSNFSGDMIEPLYHLIQKIQEQYDKGE